MRMKGADHVKHLDLRMALNKCSISLAAGGGKAVQVRVGGCGGDGELHARLVVRL